MEEDNEMDMAQEEMAQEAEANADQPMKPEYFESVLGEGIQSIYQTVMSMKKRGTPGALRHGVTGAHIIIQEILDNAQNQQAYLTIAAYAVAAAMLGTGWWDLPTITPTQQEEQAQDGATDGEVVAEGTEQAEAEVEEESESS